ncbi:MAG: CARDB domain-containing protein [Acidobacteriota bacterium]
MRFNTTARSISGAGALMLCVSAVCGAAQWLKVAGGEGADFPISFIRASDGSYAAAGYSNSLGTVGSIDAMLLKFDSSGELVTSKGLGGTAAEVFYSVVEAPGGGYVGLGATTSQGAGGVDVLLAKYSATGALQWQRTLGGSGDDVATGLAATSEGGYVLCGTTASWGFGGGNEAFMVKTDASGIVSWIVTFGDNGIDVGASIIQTADGGYLLAGTMEFAGDADALVIKTDATGSITWARTIGGSGTDSFADVVQAVDGGFVCVGKSTSFAGIGAWAVKVSGSGGAVWQRGWSSTVAAGFQQVERASGSDLVIVGSTAPGAGLGAEDVFVTRVDASGSMAWQTAYGMGLTETGMGIAGDGSGGFVVAAGTQSFLAGTLDVLTFSIDGSGSLGTSCQVYEVATASSSSATTGNVSPRTLMASAPSAASTLSTLTDGVPSLVQAFICGDAGTGANLVGSWTKLKKRGSKVNGSLKVTNSGSDAAGSFEINFVFSKKATVTKKSKLIIIKSLGGLAAGSSSTIKVSGKPPSGYKYIIAVIDPNGDVPESSDFDNTVAKGF